MPAAATPAHPDAPSLSLLGAALGGGLVLYGLRRRGAMGTAIGVAGAGLVARAVAEPLGDLLRRAGARRRAVHLEMTFEVRAPVRDAFRYFSNFENFARLLRGVESVTDHGDGRSRWTVRTPRGELLTWDALATKWVPNQVLGWTSQPGGQVESSGLLRFTAVAAERTRIDVDLRYRPCTTRLADAVRAFLTASSRSKVRRDLARTERELRDWVPPDREDAAYDAAMAQDRARV